MKESIGYKGVVLLALLGVALASPVLAQGGGMGMGGGMGAGRGGCVTLQDGAVGGPGAGPYPRAGRGMAGSQNGTRGWSLMTPEERTAFQKQMRALKTYDECVALQTEHRGAMEVRAKERGVTLLTPRQNVCDRLRARAVID